jgi:hypothetical protein
MTNVTRAHRTSPRAGLHGGRRKAHNRSAIPGPAIRPALHGEVSCVHGVNGRKTIIEGIEKETMLRRAATLEDVGNAAAFTASDRARTMTAATVNISCGALVD